MLKKGQIEDKEASQFKNEIDKMIVNLELHDPEIQLLDAHDRIEKYSELADIFSSDDLKYAFQETKW